MEKATLIYNPVFKDNRGTFAPLPVKFREGNPSILIKDWLQSNISVNPKKYTLRGLHYQSEPYAQTKLVKVITGSIIDFVIDIRKSSEDYGKCFIFDVTPNSELYVPKGFAHGFITTEDNTVVQYLVDNRYSQANEGSILWSSVPDVVEKLKGLSIEDDILISGKDSDCDTLTEFLDKQVDVDDNKKLFDKDIIICQCHSTEHQMVFLYSDDDNYPMVYTHIHLNKLPFWNRVKYGINYIFGRKSRYGAFDEFILNPSDAPKIENVLKYLKQNKNS